MLVRSTFDKAVCSEPLAVCGGTRAYGDGMAELAGLESDHAEVEGKFVWAAITERYIAEF
jgi:hypothetical protein